MINFSKLKEAGLITCESDKLISEEALQIYDQLYAQVPVQTLFDFEAADKGKSR